MTVEEKMKTGKTTDKLPTLEVVSTQSSRANTTVSKKATKKTVKSTDKSKKALKSVEKSKESKKTLKSVDKSKKALKSVEKSKNVLKSVEKSKKTEVKPKSLVEKVEKEARSGKGESKEDMPPTANSEKSAEKVQKKTGRQSAEGKKEEKPPIEERRAATPIDVAKPAQTPVPTITPGAWSDPAKTPEDTKKKKKKKEKRVLKRETNHIYHLRPGVNKRVEADRQTNFRKELINYETGGLTYLTDPTRYSFRSTPPMEVVIQFVFPSLLVLVIGLSSAAVVQFLNSSYEHEAPFNEMSEMTLSKYDTFLIVDNFTNYMTNRSVFLNKNCPGLVQGPYRKVEDYEKQFLNYEEKVVKNAWKALTYRWTHQVDAVMNMNFECPPSVIIEMEKT